MTKNQSGGLDYQEVTEAIADAYVSNPAIEEVALLISFGSGLKEAGTSLLHVKPGDAMKIDTDYKIIKLSIVKKEEERHDG